MRLKKKMYSGVAAMALAGAMVFAGSSAAQAAQYSSYARSGSYQQCQGQLAAMYAVLVVRSDIRDVRIVNCKKGWDGFYQGKVRYSYK